jgi:hypothetical protein
MADETTVGTFGWWKADGSVGDVTEVGVRGWWSGTPAAPVGAKGAQQIAALHVLRIFGMVLPSGVCSDKPRGGSA